MKLASIDSSIELMIYYLEQELMNRRCFAALIAPVLRDRGEGKVRGRGSEYHTVYGQSATKYTFLSLP